MSPSQRYMGKQLARMSAGVVLGGVSDYYAAKGDQGMARGTGYGSQIAMGAAMGGMMGGPVGAGIGALTGALASAFQELAHRAKEAADAIAEQKERFFKGQAVDNQVHDFLQAKEDRAALKKAENQLEKSGKADLSYFKNEAQRQQQWADNLQKSFEEGEIGFGGKGKERFKLREYERETQRLMELRGEKDPEVQRRQKYADLYRANIDAWMKHSNRAEQMQDIVDKLEKKQPKTMNREQLRASIMGERLEELTDRLSGMKAPDMGNVNSLASQGFMISRSDDEARMNQQNDYLRDIASITREIKNIEQQKGEGATYS